jgi:hypothetical protein
MKRFLPVLIFSILYAATLHAQTPAMGPAEKKLTDSLCSCITHLDQSTLHTKKEAVDAFMDCFGKQSDLLVAVAQEKNLSMEDNTAMHNLGAGIAKNLMTEKCQGFMALAVKMAGKDDDAGSGSNATEGKFRRMDNKGFNYIVLVDENNQEKSFLWLEQFAGSEKFADAANLAGKKLKIDWKEIEVYLPTAKGYYKVKEITAITVL